MESATAVCPGDRLGSTDTHLSGVGTYVKGTSIIASLLGTVATKKVEDKTEISVFREGEARVPGVGDEVTVSITRVTGQVANCVIECLGPHALSHGYAGLIRKEQVRETEIDKVEMSDCFRPGDIVVASVVSLGDAQSYFLSTAAPAHGVVFARHAISRQPLVPINWAEMQCPETGDIEKRKVATKALDEGKTAEGGKSG